MMGNTSQRVCVVMGDIVGSERSSAPDMLHAAFNQVVDEHNQRFSDALASPLTITLGDEFQGLTPSLMHALPIVQSMRFKLLERSIDCRFILGQADLSTPINKKNAWNMMGRGLSRAREKLNDKRVNTFYKFSLLGNELTEQLLDALGVGLSMIEQGWTRRQQEDIRDILSGQSASEIANRRNVSVHSVYKVRASGHFEAYEIQWTAIAKAFQAVDRKEFL